MNVNNENKTIRNLIWGGLITLIINLFVSYYQNIQKIKMEQNQFESTLIINAIDKWDIESSKKNIEFLINSGLISKNNQKIIPLLTDTTFRIVFPKIDTIAIEPTNNFELSNSILNSICSSQIVDEEKKPLKDVEIIIKKYPRDKSDYYAKTLTDINGLFKIPLPDSKKYIMSIQKEGYIGIQKILYKRMNPPKEIILKKKST